MTIILPALAVAFAAFCVWLGVRIVNRRERWAKWTGWILVIGLPVLYVLSFGPACWWFSDPVDELTGLTGGITPQRVSRLYVPFGWVVLNGPQSAGDAIYWYAHLRTRAIAIPMSWRDDGFMMSVRSAPGN